MKMSQKRTVIESQCKSKNQKHPKAVKDRKAFLDDMKERRDNSKRQVEKDYMHVAAIPLIVVEKWQREGFDILHDRNISLSEIVLKLKNENLDAFLATEKSV